MKCTHYRPAFHAWQNPKLDFHGSFDRAILRQYGDHTRVLSISRLSRDFDGGFPVSRCAEAFPHCIFNNPVVTQKFVQGVRMHPLAAWGPFRTL